MSQMTCCLLDADGSIHTRCSADVLDQLIPALCDDPETMEEMQHAMRRFQPPEESRQPLDGWSTGECEQPLDGEICIVDLAARLIVYQSDVHPLLRDGQVTHDEYPPDSPSKARWIHYRIADDWLVAEKLHDWRKVARQRRGERQASPALDTRVVLYEKVLVFIVDRCLAARGGSEDDGGVWTAPSHWQWRELPQRAADGRTVRVDDGVAEIHAQWLMTPRDDLLGQTPRDVLHAQRSRIEMHVQDREHQWTSFGQSPAPLWRESTAYRLGGYGTHENMVYYDLLRHLIHECWKMVIDCPTEDSPAPEAVADRLGAAKQEWLHTPNEDFGGKSPTRVIEYERLRLPEGSSGEEAMIDCDCPLCQMMAESGPVFWHLDGYHMDDDFPFAVFYTTREEWEMEQGEWAELDAQSPHEQEAGESAKNESLPWSDEEPVERSSSVWKHSFSNQGLADSPGITLFGLGGHLAELICGLKEAGEAQERIDVLNRDFGNLRQATADASSSLIQGVVASFCDHLLCLAEDRPELAPKCRDLERQLREFSRQISGETTWDVPF